jgi:hypothetical protein
MALFIMGKKRKQPKCPSIDKQNVICSYKGILFGHKKEGSTDTHCNLDET